MFAKNLIIPKLEDLYLTYVGKTALPNNLKPVIFPKKYPISGALQVNFPGVQFSKFPSFPKFRLRNCF